MKICIKCMVPKELDEFSSNIKNKDGKYSWCKSCIRVKSKNHYNKNKDKILSKQRDQNKTRIGFILSLKQGKHCLKCGIDNPVVLDFHHIDPSKKKFTIGDKSFHNRGINDREYLIEEINKCVTLCSNCHRMFHYLERRDKITLEQYLPEINSVR